MTSPIYMEFGTLPDTAVQRFKYRQRDDKRVTHRKHISDLANHFADIMSVYANDEKSLDVALLRLEEAVMWANKSMT